MKLKKNIKKGVITTFLLVAIISSASKSYANDVNRISGADRYSTSSEVSKKVYTKADKAVIANGEKFADALCAGVVSGKLKGPLLLSKSNNLSSEVSKELSRLGVKEVIIAGGQNSVSKSVENELSKNYKVVRISGADRYKTSIELAKFIKNQFELESIGIANGENFVDALAATPYVDKNKGAIILSNGITVDSQADELIKSKSVTVFGGKNSISDSIVEKYGAKRISGANRYETAINIAKEISPESKNFVLVNGNIFADALSSSTLALSMKAPIVFDSISTINYISSNPLAKVAVVGGENSVGRDTFKKIENREKNEDSSISSSSSSHTSNISNNKIVEFGDPNVKREVINVLADESNLYDKSKAIKKEQKIKYNPTKEDMENIKILNVSNILDKENNVTKAKSLKGLESAINAETVRLNGLNCNDNLEFLKKFKKIKDLSLTANNLQNIDFIKDMLYLESLNISTNKLTNISALNKLTNLRILKADGNQITNISAVKNMPNLENLTIYDNKISDISPVEKLEKLKFLQLAGNQIRSIEKIGKKPLLEELYLTGDYTKPFEEPKMEGNYFKDISPLATMTNLKVLYLQDLRLIEDISPLRNLTNLRELSIRNNKVKNVEPLKNLTKLEVLYLYKNQISDISCLENLENMQEFNFAVNKVKDMSVIEKLPNVNFLMAYANELTDLSSINKAKSLMVVNAHRNHISDYSPLKQFFEEKPESNVELDSQSIKVSEKASKIEKENGIVKIFLKNPLKDISGNRFVDIAKYTELKADEDTSNEIKDFYEMYNKAMNKLKEKNIKVETEGDQIVVSIPETNYNDEGENKLELPFYRNDKIKYSTSGEEETYSFYTIGGFIDFTIEINR